SRGLPIIATRSRRAHRACGLSLSAGYAERESSMPAGSHTPHANPPNPVSRFRIPTLPGGHGAVPKDNTYAIPAVRGDSLLALSDIVGAAAATEIEATGRLSFHCVGDSGRGPGTNQQAVAEAMSRDIDPTKHATSPAFLLHLGDVIYGDGKRDL